MPIQLKYIHAWLCSYVESPQWCAHDRYIYITYNISKSSSQHVYVFEVSYYMLYSKWHFYWPVKTAIYRLHACTFTATAMAQSSNRACYTHCSLLQPHTMSYMMIHLHMKSFMKFAFLHADNNQHMNNVTLFSQDSKYIEVDHAWTQWDETVLHASVCVCVPHKQSQWNLSKERPWIHTTKWPSSIISCLIHQPFCPVQCASCIYMQCGTIPTSITIKYRVAWQVV